jgi:hypothetical protein
VRVCDPSPGVGGGGAGGEREGGAGGETRNRALPEAFLRIERVEAVEWTTSGQWSERGGTVTCTD